VDESCLALESNATSQIEDLMWELKENYSIIMVTHSMQKDSACLAAHRLFLSQQPFGCWQSRVNIPESHVCADA